MIDLTGKTALVTGGSRGIGRAVALRLAEAGAYVFVLDRSDWKLLDSESCSGEIRRRGGRAESRELDVSDSAQVTAVIGAIAAERDIDILVNNAGVLHAGTVTETSDEDWRNQFAINVDGTFFCTRASLNAMIQAGHGGKIVNISSISGLRANPGFAAYCSSKAAIVNFTRQAGIDYAAKGINVNGVAPGFVETDMTALYSPEVRAALEGQTPNGKWATPAQIADSVLFLCSSLADHICGEILAVDGGWLVGTPVVVATPTLQLR
jgi:NAD(P)-dependent dehydrogenase (short-subunit alcohol dehydrogenase family)